MKFYNTMTRTMEEFVPLQEGRVTMYACGPTVYDYFHIGNGRCFVLFDMLRRYLIWRGYQVKFVQNFTDIDDKMIRRAAEEGTTVAQIADRYIREYETDARGLGIQPADVHPRATEHIADIIAMVQKLVDSGHAYASGGDVYFRTRSFPGYGKLSHTVIEDLESGARIDVSEQKEDPLDFALWKAYKPGEPCWDSPWGKGRPGWHIECSAMSCKYLGETIDIHCGGQDLTFPHHENEIAQSEAASGKDFVHFWLHNGYINVDNQKMSKSLKNFFTVRDVAEKFGYMPIRFFLLSAQYRSPVNYTLDVMQQSKLALERLWNCEDNLRFYVKNNAAEVLPAEEQKYLDALAALRTRFIDVMDDDFNTADGISVLFELVRLVNQLLAGEPKPSGALAKHMLTLYEELVGLMGFLKPVKQEDDGLKAKIEDAIARRAAAKAAKNYAEADRIRAELLEAGVILEDTKQGTKYRMQS